LTRHPKRSIQTIAIAWGGFLFGFVATFEEEDDDLRSGRAEEVGDRVEGFFGGGEKGGEDEQPDKRIGGIEGNFWRHGGLGGIDGDDWYVCGLHDGLTSLRLVDGSIVGG
jgi:hypothetical protein